MNVLISLSNNQPLAAEKNPLNQDVILEKVIDLLKEKDTLSAIEYINGIGDSEKVAKVYSDLIKSLYWEEKNISYLVIVGQASVQYLLTKSNEVKESNKELSKKLRVAAQINSFNLASFTWPGWDEPGISITPNDITFGLDMAKLDLRLATEMDYPPIKLSNANWINGAHYMATKQYTKAHEYYEEALKNAENAKNQEYVYSTKAYIGLNELLEGKTSGEIHFNEAIDNLKKIGTEDAKSFIDQLETAKKFFTSQKIK